MCDWCGETVTEDRMPGPLPKFCQACTPEARRSLNTARVQKLRAQQAIGKLRRPVGRPRKG